MYFQQKAIKQSLCGSLRHDAHWKCLILTVLIYSCLGAVAWCRLTIVNKQVVDYYISLTPLNRSNPCNDGYIYIPVAFVIMLYLVYLVECWHSHTRIELQYKVDINSVYDRVAIMKDALPIIWWKAICYHYVRRTRQVTRYRNGDAFTSSQIYYERVNSCTAGSAFNFTNCGIKDKSKKLCALENYPATKIRFTKGFSFVTIEAECEFEDQRAQFFQEYETRDDYMEGREGMDLLNVNFKEYMIAFADPDHLPWYVSNVIFWVASFLLLSWPLRVIIEYKTAHLHYHVHKCFGTNYVNATVVPTTISRATTMNSTDFEMNIRNNNILVPSYSEALLFDPTIQRYTPDANGFITTRVPPRSLTFSALPPSSSSGFIRAFFSRDFLSNMRFRTYNSCTAIGDEDRHALTRHDDEDCVRSDSFRRKQKQKKQKRPTSTIHLNTFTRAVTVLTSPERTEERTVNFYPSSLPAVNIRPENRRSSNMFNASSSFTHSSHADSVISPDTPSENIIFELGEETDHADVHTSGSDVTQPPPYEDALNMQRLSAGTPDVHSPEPREQSTNENQTVLSPDTARRYYRTIECMETAL